MRKILIIIIGLLFLGVLSGCGATRVDKNIGMPDCMHVSLGTIDYGPEFIELIPSMTYVFQNGELLYSSYMGYKYIQDEEGKIIVIDSADETKGYYVDVEKEFFEVDATDVLGYIEGKKVAKTFWSNQLTYKSEDYNFTIYNLDNSNFRYFVFPNNNQFGKYDIEVNSNNRIECDLQEYTIENGTYDSLYNHLDYMSVIDENTLEGSVDTASISISLDPLEFYVEDDNKSFTFKFMTHQFCLKEGDSYECDDEGDILYNNIFNEQTGEVEFEFIDYFGRDLCIELKEVLIHYYRLMYDHDYVVED